MNNFVFYSPTEFVFGKDTDIQTGTLAKKYNARKVMIVYGEPFVLGKFCSTSCGFIWRERQGIKSGCGRR